MARFAGAVPHDRHIGPARDLVRDAFSDCQRRVPISVGTLSTHVTIVVSITKIVYRLGSSGQQWVTRSVALSDAGSNGAEFAAGPLFRCRVACPFQRRRRRDLHSLHAHGFSWDETTSWSYSSHD